MSNAINVYLMILFDECCFCMCACMQTNNDHALWTIKNYCINNKSFSYTAEEKVHSKNEEGIENRKMLTDEHITLAHECIQTEYPNITGPK